MKTEDMEQAELKCQDQLKLFRLLIESCKHHVCEWQEELRR